MSNKPVPLHPLGKNCPNVPALGYDLMGLSYDTYGSVPGDEERFAILDRAYELGARFWDSSDLYGDGEELLKEWFKRTGKRDEVFLATNSGEYCKKACAESLRHLGVELIDLYYMHHANSNTPIEETMRALAELQAEGKIKYIGQSSISSNTLRRACKIVHVDAIQVEYSPFVLDIEGPAGTDLLATARELGVAIVAAMPLGRGLLTSTFASGAPVGESKDMGSKVMPRFQEANWEKNVKLVGQWQEIAQKKGCTATQLALAWMLKQGDDVFPIPGTKRMKYLEENWSALDVQLTGEDVAEIRHFVESAEIAGGCMPPRFEHYLFSDTVEEA